MLTHPPSWNTQHDKNTDKLLGAVPYKILGALRDLHDHRNPKNEAHSHTRDDVMAVVVQ